MALSILYSFRRCPYAMRARWALRYSGITVVVREVGLRDKLEALREASPKATVPVLCLPDGRVLEESLHIMEWALQQADPEGWLRAGDVTLGAALIADNDGPFKRLLDRYKYPHRQLGSGGSSSAMPSASEPRDEAVARYLRPLDERLQVTRCLFADTPALADIAIVPFVRQFALVDAAWFESTALHSLRRWLGELLGTPLFEQVMVKLAPWRPGDSDTLF